MTLIKTLRESLKALQANYSWIIPQLFHSQLQYGIFRSQVVSKNSYQVESENSHQLESEYSRIQVESKKSCIQLTNNYRYGNKTQETCLYKKQPLKTCLQTKQPLKT